MESVKYWAGQKLLHSPFHPYYLKLTGKEPKPQTYDAWLAAEPAPRLGGVIPAGYRVVLPAGARMARGAEFWFAQAIAATSADLIYADEDVAVEGRRRDPVFKPAWSPELFEHCDYIGGAYVARTGVEPGPQTSAIHIPRVLFHRAASALYRPRQVSIRNASTMVSVIVCSRSAELAGDCLAAIRATTDYQPFEIVLIDHRADLGSVAGRFGAKRVFYDETFNFARMCNIGVRASEGGLLLFLNDDAVPLDRQWMRRMAGQAERDDVGAVGALLTYPDSRIQHAGVYIGTPNGAGHPGRLTDGSAIWPWLAHTREQLAVTGACLMMRRRVFEQAGGFDEFFPVNYNDVDLCLRCGQAGYKVILEAAARLEHRESTSRKTGIRYGERRRFLDRWANVIDRGDPYLNPNLTNNEQLLPDPESFARVGQWR